MSELTDVLQAIESLCQVAELLLLGIGKAGRNG
jgi:hypothetical protein